VNGALVIDGARQVRALLTAVVMGAALLVAAQLGGARSSAPAAAIPASALTPASSGSGLSEATGALDPRIGRLAAGTRVQAIVQFQAGVPVSAARALVARAGGQVFAQLHIIPALAVRLTAGQARRLAADPAVHAVSLNATIRGSSAGFDPLRRLVDGGLGSAYDLSSGATALWRWGLTGRGIGVAVIDTGIDGQLPDFAAPSGGSRVIATAVTNPSARTVLDTYGHGTDVAGIIAGNGNLLSSSDPLRGRYSGVAPDANLISIKASDDTGAATVLNVIYGLQFAVDHAAQYNIRVVNLSLDAATPQSYTTDPLDAAAESAWMHGLVVVAAAGNRGSAPGAVSYAPANDPYVITVGATDAHGGIDPAADTIAPFSSRGVTQDGFAKPDVTAPGAHIISVLAPGSAFATLCPGCAIGGEYIKTSGTSMAAPVVSGLIADLLQAHGDLTPDEVKAIVTDPAAFSNPATRELSGFRALWVHPSAPANQGLTPNSLISDAAGNVDPSASSWSASSWSASSWSAATGALAAGFAASSWSCTCSGAGTQPVGTSASSWSASSWSASSWSVLEPLVSDPETVPTNSPAWRAITDAGSTWQSDGTGGDR
jgi:serine protease AprX